MKLCLDLLTTYFSPSENEFICRWLEMKEGTPIKSTVLDEVHKGTKNELKYFRELYNN
jgi:hypothetical protein